jgi:hypothetical protein
MQSQSYFELGFLLKTLEFRKEGVLGVIWQGCRHAEDLDEEKNQKDASR